MILIFFVLCLYTPVVFSRNAIFDWKNPKYAEDVERFVGKKEVLIELTNEILGVSPSKTKKSFGNTTEIEENPYIFEGDIIVTEGQLDEMILDARNQLMEKKYPNFIREKRAAFVTNSSQLWTMPISYMIEKGVNEKVVFAGIQKWESETCVRFARRYVADWDYIWFVNEPGCSSSMGMVGGLQFITLENGQCDRLGQVTHEIAHALGVYHEQSRPDRDQYVTINTNNILTKRLQRNFEIKSSANYYGSAYDYNSVMHYMQYDMAIIKSIPTITTKDPYYQETIGQSDGPSFADVKAVNDAYCKNKCRNYIFCFAGYQDPNNCDQCKCPWPFSGKFCNVTTVASTCGNELTGTADLQTLTVEGAKTCTIVIRSPSNMQRLNITITELKFNAVGRCWDDYVDLYWQSLISRAPTRFCIQKPPPIVSKNPKFVVVYKSGRANSRFSLTYHTF